MNLVRKGYSRDNRIVELVEQCGVLTTDQVASWLFSDIKTGHRKAQERLQKLAKGKHLSRSRLAVSEPYAYYTGRLMAQAMHRIELNWALIWLIKQMSSWERVVSWEYEVDYDFLRPDLLFVAENKVTKQYRAVYVELDRSPRNKWDKTVKYNRLYRDGKYLADWWVEQADRFPLILVATTEPSRARAIRTSLELENEHGLRFDVKMTDTVRKEAWPWS